MLVFVKARYGHIRKHALYCAREQRRHGNLTDFEGLVAYRSVIGGSRGIDEEKADVIRYDYQLTDDCGRLLSACGYKIVKRCPAADAAVRGEETP